MWQHLALAVRRKIAFFLPGVGQTAVHPVPQARFALVTSPSLTPIPHELTTAWGQYAPRSAGVGFDQTYPPDLVRRVADLAVECLSTLGVTPADRAPAGGVVKTLNEAWERPRADPLSYREWEERALQTL